MFSLDGQARGGETHHVFVSANPTSRTARRQRRGAFLLCFALCFWLFAFASHVHSHEDLGEHGKSRTACTFCLSLPSGAPAPALLQVADAPAAIAIDLTLPLPRHDQEAPSSYLIRGPPQS
jgi:hypothetical protein